MSRFENRTAVVTGGAGGIGLATAQRLADEGARVVLVDRDEPGLQVAARALPSASLAGTVVADVTDAAAVSTAVGRSIELLGRIDVLINNAGVYDVVPFLELEPERWDSVIDIDLKGIFLFGQAVAKEMVKAGGGSIVNTSSIAAIAADRDGASAHYNAAKAGVLNLTKQMAAELGEHGIRVNAVCPGLIDTKMLRPDDFPPGYVGTAVPIGRIGRPEEVAALIAFLASDDAGYVTGEAVVVDGGLTLS